MFQYRTTLRHSAVFQKNVRRNRIGGEHLAAEAQQAPVPLVDDETLLGIAYRRLQAFRQRQPAIFFGQQRQCRRRAGNAGGQRAVFGSFGDEIAFRIQIHILMRGQGGFLPAIQHHLVVIRLTMQQPETAAAQTGPRRLHHRQRGADRDGGIEGIAAPVDDFEACSCRQRVGAGNRCTSRP